MQVGKRSERLLIETAREQTKDVWCVSLLGGLHCRLPGDGAVCGSDLTGGIPWETLPPLARFHVNICLVCQSHRLASHCPLPADLPKPGWYQHPAVMAHHFFRGLVAACSTVVFHAAQGWRAVRPPVEHAAICQRCNTIAWTHKTNALLALTKSKPDPIDVKPELQRAYEEGIRFPLSLMETITSKPVLNTLVNAEMIATRGEFLLDQFVLKNEKIDSTLFERMTLDQQKVQVLLYIPRFVESVVFRLLGLFVGDYVTVSEEKLRRLTVDAGMRAGRHRDSVKLAHDDLRPERLLLLHLREQLLFALKNDPSTSTEIVFTIVLRALHGPYSHPYYP